jgi:hypothetical protein
MGRNDEPVEIEFDEVEHETSDSVLFLIGDDKVWLPKSQIIEQDDGVVTIPEWLAIDRDLV